MDRGMQDGSLWHIPRYLQQRGQPIFWGKQSPTTAPTLSDAQAVLEADGFGIVGIEGDYYTVDPPEGWMYIDDPSSLRMKRSGQDQLRDDKGHIRYYLDHGKLSDRPVIYAPGDKPVPNPPAYYRQTSKPSYGDWARVIAIWTIALSFLGLSIAYALEVRITDAEAIGRFEVLLGSDDVVIQNRSNNWPVIGSPGYVTYELMVDGQKFVSGECTDGLWQPLVCKTYSAQ